MTEKNTILPDEPEGEPQENGTAAVVLGAAAGTLAGSLLGPVGAVVGAVAGGAFATAVSAGALPDVGDIGDDQEADEVQKQTGQKQTGQNQDPNRGRSMVGDLGKAMNNMMHEMGLDNGGLDKAITKMTDGNGKQIQENFKQGMQEVAKNETASIAVGGAVGAVAGSILGPVGTVVGAVAGGMLGDRLSEAGQAQNGGGQGQSQSQQGSSQGQSQQGSGQAHQSQSQQGSGQAHQSQSSQGSHTAHSPREAVQCALQTCTQTKDQLVAQMNAIPSPEGRTVLQMAINAVNQSVVDLQSASNVL